MSEAVVPEVLAFEFAFFTAGFPRPLARYPVIPNTTRAPVALPQINRRLRFPETTGIVPTNKPAISLCLNAELLARLQKALGGNAVRVEIHALGREGEVDPTVPLTIRPIYLEGPATEDGSLGVLMPIRGD